MYYTVMPKGPRVSTFTADPQDGLIEIAGEVTNTAAAPAQNVAVTIAMLDAQGLSLGTEETTVATVAAGGTAAFTASVQEPEGTERLNVFVDGSSPVLVDQDTGLMWWAQNVPDTAGPWDAALSYCAGLEYAGFDDWRLPDRYELQSIVDYRALDGRSAYVHSAFDGVAAAPYWTSSSTADFDALGVWVVSFATAQVDQQGAIPFAHETSICAAAVQ